MFGYVGINKDKMSNEQYSVYKSVYCSLCKTMGKEYSIFSRFILSYDCTFYALLIISLKNKKPVYCVGRCTFNPFTKCSYISNEDAFSLAAALSVITAYYKIIDNINDTNNFKKFFYKIISKIFKKWSDKAKIKYPLIEEAVLNMSLRQSEIEKDKNCLIDKACDPTATMLSTVCSLIVYYFESYISDTNVTKRILSNFGYHLGRWIYLMDALDDYFDDKNKDGFNPLIIKYKGKLMIDDVERLLNHSLSEMLLSYKLLDKSKYDSILSNIMYYGLPNKQNLIINKIKKGFENYE